MNLSVYDLTVPQYKLTLKALKKVLHKGKTFADTKKIDMSVLFQSRLAADMFPLGRQIQIVCDGAKFGVARLTGLEAPKFEDNEKTFEEFTARIDKTIAFLETVKAEQFQGYESKKITFPWHPGKWMDGKTYLVQHSLPNFYFHLTTAYDILRHIGVDLGKSDYLGEQNWKSE